MDDSVAARDQCGAVVTGPDGARVIYGLADAVDHMRTQRIPLDLKELFRYVDELREQRLDLLKERGDLQSVIGKRQREIIRQEVEIESLKGTIAGQKAVIEKLIGEEVEKHERAANQDSV